MAVVVDVEDAEFSDAGSKVALSTQFGTANSRHMVCT